MDRILIFKHIVQHLKDWYKEYHGFDENDFQSYNDFSTLKIIKLDFLLAAVNSESNPIILDNSEFYAMPYGPVETQVYNELRNNNVNGHQFSNSKMTQQNEFQLPELNSDIVDAIKNSCNTLKTLEPELINADAGSLVDLTHKWSCWKKNYALARARNCYSSIIPTADIVNDIKIINLDLF